MSPDLAELLRAARRTAGLTQEELAERSGISVRAISDLERGRARAPQRRTVEALVTAAGLGSSERLLIHRIAKTARTGQENALPGFTKALCEPPCAIGDFAGRDAELDWLVELGKDQTTSTAVLTGPPGIGKTSLAIRAGATLAPIFPGGFLFLELDGLAERPPAPPQLLRRLLGALGVEEDQLPQQLDDLVPLYRALQRERPVLVLLDNAADEAQARPLAATMPGSFTIITSRRGLTGLESAAWQTLDGLDSAEALDLLASIAGQARIDQEPLAAAQVAELCGRLPLALRIAGNQLASRPRWSIRQLADRLGESRFPALEAGDLRVRAAFDVSYRQLSEQAATVFRRLALVDGELSAEVAAVVADLPECVAADAIEELADASLLTPMASDQHYEFHDLLHAFARALLADDPHEDAQRRFTDWLLTSATKAGLHFLPPTIRPHRTVRSAPVAAIGTRQEAFAWLQSRQRDWIAALRVAASEGRHDDVLALTEAMHWYSDLGVAPEIWPEVFELGVAAARAIGSTRDEAVQLNLLGWAVGVLLERREEGVRLCRLALAASDKAGEHAEAGWSLFYLASLDRSIGDLAAASATIDQAIDRFLAGADPLGEHIARSARATLLLAEGRPDEAIDTHRRAVAFFRRPEHHPETGGGAILLAHRLLPLANALSARQEWEQALAVFTEAVGLFREAGMRSGEARARHGLGSALRGVGDLEAARDELAAAVKLLRETGAGHTRVRAQRDLAAVLDDLGETTQARETRANALEFCLAWGTPETRALAEELRAETGSF
ncbi:NB-ARC domain-containing protein [Amycolatopsis xylanica]|uniref:NB-ARC domain-containing protein n=1 Tax=Amycolatopsis xylanica TaxID=589385 RepID=A0A1H3EHJ5_9PSEU|nr:helix-turn-helix domain-containing protein [Amycolatopsis xylanica]SDX77404.1 NB-ARC domain-containing protein [Amycolatopsis xylanica]